MTTKGQTAEGVHIEVVAGRAARRAADLEIAFFPGAGNGSVGTFTRSTPGNMEAGCSATRSRDSEKVDGLTLPT